MAHLSKLYSDVCVNDIAKLWIKGIVRYKFRGDVPRKLVDIVKMAMKIIEEVSSIKFVERTNQIDYVEIIDGGRYYSSFVGRKGGRQVITKLLQSLQQGGALY